MSSLTDEQRKMIDEKRKAAQTRLATKSALKSTPQPVKNSHNQSALSKLQSVVSPTSSGKTISINYNQCPKTFKSKPVHGTCELTSKHRFTIHIGYHKEMIDIFKTVLSKQYGKSNFFCINVLPTKSFNIFLDTITSEWSFHIKDHDQLMIRLKPLESNVKIEKLPRYIIKVRIFV